MSAELCLITPESKTGVQMLEEHNRSIASTKLVVKRFPDAILRAGRWESKNVKTSTAKEVDLSCQSGLLGEGWRAELFVILRPKGCEPVRVYAPKLYKLTSAHIQTVLQDNPKLVLQGLAKALTCQETP